MKRFGVLLALVGMIVAGGCSGGDVTQGGALDKHKQIEEATKNSGGNKEESRD